MTHKKKGQERRGSERLGVNMSCPPGRETDPACGRLGPLRLPEGNLRRRVLKMRSFAGNTGGLRLAKCAQAATPRKKTRARAKLVEAHAKDNLKEGTHAFSFYESVVAGSRSGADVVAS